MRQSKGLKYEKLYTDPAGGAWWLTYGCAKKQKLRKGSNSSDIIQSGLNWSDVLCPGAFHLIFNLQGQAVIMGGQIRLGIATSTIAMCCPNNHVIATRLCGNTDHEFIVLSIQPAWLEKTLSDKKESIYPSIWEVIRGSEADTLSGKPLGEIRAMTLAEKDMARQMTDPPVELAALPFWYAAKVTEILALHMFRPNKEEVTEPFCLGQKRINRERVDHVIRWLTEHMEDSLDLKKLAQHIGCAPHYLSRVFSKEMNTTISQYLRAIRIERASALMDTGRYNVTEAAFEVGYNSMSHFTKAFVQEKGVTPSAYLKGALHHT
ncbi:MAG: helix-turn-helix domain-containing protein [Akkermansiaceae bacterium]